jgi:threonine dehydratase
VIGVEPEGAPSVTAALEAGQVVPLAALNTIADGLAAPMTADRVLAHVRRFVDDIITVPDTLIADAMRLILERAKLLAEPAGAAGLAGLLSGRVQIAPGSRVVVVVSGGNIDLTRLKELLP